MIAAADRTALLPHLAQPGLLEEIAHDVGRRLLGEARAAVGDETHVGHAARLSEKRPRRRLILSLLQNAASDRDDGVGGEDDRAFFNRADSRRLGLRKAQRIGARRLAGLRRFIDIRGDDFRRLDADLFKKGAPARAGACENERRAGHERLI